MVIKGSSRGQSKADALRLAHHLLSDENESASVLALKGVLSTDLVGAIEEIRLLTLSSRARNGLYHASLSPDPTEAASLTPAQWLQAVIELEKALSLTGHQRIIVRHEKHGRIHLHVVWGRIHPTTLKLARDSHNYRIHEEVSRALEQKFGLRPVIGAFTRPKGTDRPVAKLTHADAQIQKRTGIKADDVADQLRRAWDRTKTAQAFQLAIEQDGLILAIGRRGIVAVDAKNSVHSLPRRLGLKAAEVQQRLVGLDIKTLPTFDEIKKQGVRPSNRREIMRTKREYKPVGAMAPHPVSIRNKKVSRQGCVQYWQNLGFQVDDDDPNYMLVILSPTCLLQDYGNRLVLTGEVSDEAIRQLVAAGKERGWHGIRFTGSEDFQRRARIEALKQGFPLDKISCEMDDHLPKTDLVMPLPAHIARRINPLFDKPQEPVPKHKPTPEEDRTWAPPAM